MITRSGQQLGYDALRRLISWQNEATSPTQTASYAYNGSGERVQQTVTSGGATTTTSYLGGYEEVSVTGPTTTTTKYYSAGLATVTNVNGTLSYLVHDTLGSVSASLTASGGLQSAQLFAPYGAVRYSTGSMPTTYGFTGQRSDPSGLMYYHARYYDPSVGQFASADVAQGPNRYGYVAGNPETQTDPTGQRLVCDDDSATCHPHRSPGPQPPPVDQCRTDSTCGGYSLSGGGTSPQTNPNPAPPEKPSHDTQGHCTSYAACDKDKGTAAKAAKDQGDGDKALGGFMVLMSAALRLLIDHDEAAKALDDVIDIIMGLKDFFPFLILHLPGGNPLVGALSAFLSDIPKLLGAVRAAQSLMHGWAFLNWGWKLVASVMDVSAGPIGEAIKEGAKIFGSAVLYGTGALGYDLMHKGEREVDHAWETATETTGEWCEKTSNCSSTWNAGT